MEVCNTASQIEKKLVEWSEGRLVAKESIDKNIIPTISNKVQQFDQKAAGVLDVIGSKIEVSENGKTNSENLKDLAKTLEIYSDKRYETARYLFIKNGECIRHVAVSSQTPSSTVIEPNKDYLYKLKAYAEQTDSQIVFCHNHPSGFVAPSQQDIKITNFIQNVLDTGNFDSKGQETGKKYFAGHVILDHGTYGIYTPENEWFAVINDKYAPMEKVAENYVIPSNQYNIQIQDKKDLASISDYIKTHIDSVNEWNKQDWIPVAFATVNGIVKDIELISVSEFVNYETLQTKLKNIGRENNSESIYFVPYKNEYEQMRLCEAFAKKTNLVKDIYFENDIDGYSLSKYSGGTLFSPVFNPKEIKVEDTALFSEKTINEAKEKNASKNILRKQSKPTEKNAVNINNSSKENNMAKNTTIENSDKIEGLFKNELQSESEKTDKTQTELDKMTEFDIEDADEIFAAYSAHLADPYLDLSELADYNAIVSKCENLITRVDVSKLKPEQAAQFMYFVNIALSNQTIPEERLASYQEEEKARMLEETEKRKKIFEEKKQAVQNLIDEYKREEGIEDLTQEVIERNAEILEMIELDSEMSKVIEEEAPAIEKLDTETKKETEITIVESAKTDLKAKQLDKDIKKAKAMLTEAVREKGAEFQTIVDIEYLKRVAKQNILNQYNLTPKEYDEIADKYARNAEGVATESDKITKEELEIIGKALTDTTESIMEQMQQGIKVAYKDPILLKEVVTYANAITTQKAVIKDAEIVRETSCKPNKKLRDHYKTFSETHPRIARATKFVSTMGFGVVKTAVISATLGAPGLAVYSAYNTVNTIRKSYKRFKENGIEQKGEKKNFKSFLKHLSKRENKAELIGFVGQIAATTISANFAFGLNLAGITNRQVTSAVASAAIGVAKGVNAYSNKKYAKEEIHKIFSDKKFDGIVITDHVIKVWSKMKNPAELDESIRNFGRQGGKNLFTPEEFAHVKEMVGMYKNNNVGKAVSVNLLAAAAGLAANAQIREYVKSKFGITPPTSQAKTNPTIEQTNTQETPSFDNKVTTIRESVVKSEISTEPTDGIDFKVGANTQSQEFTSAMHAEPLNIDTLNSENLQISDKLDFLAKEREVVTGRINGIQTNIAANEKEIEVLKALQAKDEHQGLYYAGSPAFKDVGGTFVNGYLPGGSFEDEFLHVSKYIPDGKIRLDNISAYRMTDSYAQACGNGTLEPIRDDFARSFMGTWDKLNIAKEDSFKSWDLYTKQEVNAKFNQLMAVMELEKKGFDVSQAMDELKVDFKEMGYDGDIEKLIPKEMIVNSLSYAKSPVDYENQIAKLEKEITTLSLNNNVQQAYLKGINEDFELANDKLFQNEQLIASINQPKIENVEQVAKTIAEPKTEIESSIPVVEPTDEIASSIPNIESNVTVSNSGSEMQNIESLVAQSSAENTIGDNFVTSKGTFFPDIETESVATVARDYAGSLSSEVVLSQNVDSVVQETVLKDEEEKRKEAEKTREELENINEGDFIEAPDVIEPEQTISDNLESNKLEISALEQELIKLRTQIERLENQNQDLKNQIETIKKEGLGTQEQSNLKQDKSAEKVTEEIVQDEPVFAETLSNDVEEKINKDATGPEPKIDDDQVEQESSFPKTEQSKDIASLNALTDEKTVSDSISNTSSQNPEIKTNNKPNIDTEGQNQGTSTDKKTENPEPKPEDAIKFNKDNAYERYAEVPPFGLFNKETGKYEEIRNAKFHSIGENGQIMLSVASPDGKSQKPVMVDPKQYDEIVKRVEEFNKEIKDHNFSKDSADYKVSMEQLRVALNLDKDTYRINNCANFQHNFGILCQKNPGLTYEETMKLAKEKLIDNMGPFNQQQQAKIEKTYSKAYAATLRRIYDNASTKDLMVSESIGKSEEKIEKTIYKVGDSIKMTIKEKGQEGAKLKAYQIAGVDNKTNKILLKDPVTKEQYAVSKKGFVQKAREIKKSAQTELNKLQRKNANAYEMGR